MKRMKQQKIVLALLALSMLGVFGCRAKKDLPKETVSREGTLESAGQTKESSITEAAIAETEPQTATEAPLAVQKQVQRDDGTTVVIFTDGTATARVGAVELWTDAADPESEEGIRRQTVISNIGKDRPVPSEGRKITDAFILPSSPSFPGREAKAIVKCEGGYYYYLDLSGVTANGETPVILQQFEELQGEEIESFEFRTDTVFEDEVIHVRGDHQWAVYPDGSEVEVQVMADTQVDIPATKEEYLKELAYLEEMEEQIVNATNQSELNDYTNQTYEEWDFQLNRIYQLLLAVLPEEEQNTLIAEELAWIEMKESELNQIAREYEGGSITGTEVGAKGIGLTKKRTLDLIDLYYENID